MRPFLCDTLYLISGEYEQALSVLQAMVESAERGGAKLQLGYGLLYYAPVVISLGRMQHGMEIFDKAWEMIFQNKRKMPEVMYEYFLGKVYASMATGPKPGLGVLAKNVGFLMKNVPTAPKQAVEHLTQAISLAQKSGSKGLIGLASLDLGLFYQAKKQPERARQVLTEAVQVFREMGAEMNLKRAEEALASLG